MRLIDADAFVENNKDLVDREIEHPKYQNTVRELINDAPTIKTKQIKYFDEDEKVWKVGEVIVDE